MLSRCRRRRWCRRRRRGNSPWLLDLSLCRHRRPSRHQPIGQGLRRDWHRTLLRRGASLRVDHRIRRDCLSATAAGRAVIYVEIAPRRGLSHGRQHRQPRRRHQTRCRWRRERRTCEMCTCLYSFSAAQPSLCWIPAAIRPSSAHACCRMEQTLSPLRIHSWLPTVHPYRWKGTVKRVAGCDLYGTLRVRD